MNRITCACCVMTAVALVCSCAQDKVVIEDKPDYADYSPGFTGYTMGYKGYGDYDSGYGPSFWNPRYYFYTGANQGYGVQRF